MKQKAIRKLAFNFYYWTGWPKPLFRYESHHRQWELKADHSKTGRAIYWPRSLLKGSQGACSSEWLIHRARKAPIFSPSPPFQRILLEAVFKAGLCDFGSQSHVFGTTVSGKVHSDGMSSAPLPTRQGYSLAPVTLQTSESTSSCLGPSVGTIPALARTEPEAFRFVF